MCFHNALHSATRIELLCSGHWKRFWKWSPGSNNGLISELVAMIYSWWLWLIMGTISMNFGLIRIVNLTLPQPISYRIKTDVRACIFTASQSSISTKSHMTKGYLCIEITWCGEPLPYYVLYLHGTEQYVPWSWRHLVQFQMCLEAVIVYLLYPVKEAFMYSIVAYTRPKSPYDS